jgi:hypothetical protein
LSEVKKGLDVRATEAGLYEVYFAGGVGGSTPDELKGRYTHKDIAHTAIDVYQTNLAVKVKAQSPKGRAA